MSTTVIGVLISLVVNLPSTQTTVGERTVRDSDACFSGVWGESWHLHDNFILQR